MAYIEIKAIKTVAAVHRGVVNLAIRSLKARDKRADKRKARQEQYAEDLFVLARNTAYKADEVKDQAKYEHTKEKRSINAATNTVLNLRDDLNKIS